MENDIADPIHSTATQTAADFSHRFPFTAGNRMDVSAGGLLKGPGGERDDLIPAIAPVGTWIINAAAVRLIGVDRLDRISALVAAKSIKGWFSPGEYVIRPAVSAVLGRKLLQTTCDIGNDVHRGRLDANGKMVELLVEAFDEAIAELERGPITPVDPDKIRADETEDGIRLGLGGNLGVALGAGVDEINRSRTQDRADQAEARANEALELQKQTAAPTIALHGIQLSEAKQKQDEATAVRNHLNAWQQGRDKIQAGDYSDFSAALQEYNKNQEPFDDGYTFAAQSTPKGQVLNHINSDGKILGVYSKDDALKLYELGMSQKLKFLSPTYFAAAQKAQAEAHEKEADRKTKLDIANTYAGSRNYAADARYDAAVDAADIRGDATVEAAGIRGSLRGGLTATQERANLEIDAARETVAGLVPQEIQRRTAKTTNTGRENPDFDPGLARAASLAARRKVGTDDWFDKRQGQQKPAVGSDRADVGTRFTADPAMKGYALGKETPNGVEVLKEGRVIGHYR